MRIEEVVSNVNQNTDTTISARAVYLEVGVCSCSLREHLIERDNQTRLPGYNGDQEKHPAGTASFENQYLASGLTHTSDMMVEIIPRMNYLFQIEACPASTAAYLKHKNEDLKKITNILRSARHGKSPGWCMGNSIGNFGAMKAWKPAGCRTR